MAAFGGSKGGGAGDNGLSGADMAFIQQATGKGSQMIHNRYTQLGLGVPQEAMSDPAHAAQHAAATGTNLHYGQAGTAEQTDLMGLSQQANAALGQLQTANTNNPNIPGTPANLGQGLQNSQFSQGFNSGGNTGNTGGDQGGGQTGTG